MERDKATLDFRAALISNWRMTRRMRAERGRGKGIFKRGT
jgi:hypothetical protein